MNYNGFWWIPGNQSNKNKKFYICDNSLNQRELKKYHVLDLPHGEQGFINYKPFVYHFGRGTSRGEHLKKLWIKKTTEYLGNIDG